MFKRLDKGKTIKLLWIICFVILCTVTFSPALSFETKRPSAGVDYNASLSGNPTSLDPAYITGIYAVSVANNIFDGLVEFDKDLNIVPAISEFWKISRNHRTYTFFLRKDVRFHNDRKVVADDFVYSFSRILHPDTKSPVASLFFSIEGAKAFHDGKIDYVEGLKAVDSHTLSIQLEKPHTPFLSILAMANAKVVPKELIGKTFGKSPIGTGPFRFDSWEQEKTIILKANDHYFNGRPRINTLCFHIYANIEWEKIHADFERGFLDQSIIPRSHYADVISKPSANDRYTFISKPSLNLVYIGINATLSPLKDLKVRRAICHAVDTHTIVKTVTGRGAVSSKGILPPGIAGFDPEYKGYVYDLEKAKVLMAEAGYGPGQDKKIPPLEIWTVSKSESVKQELFAYKKYLAEIGIELIPKVADNWSSFKKLLTQKSIPFFYLVWYADYPDPDNFLHPLFQSESKTNRTSYSNPLVDRLIEQAREESDYLKRTAIYRKVQNSIMNDAPIIPQHVNSFNYIFQPWVKGIEVSYLGTAYLPFRKMWIER